MFLTQGAFKWHSATSRKNICLHNLYDEQEETDSETHKEPGTFVLTLWFKGRGCKELHVPISILDSFVFLQRCFPAQTFDRHVEKQSVFLLYWYEPLTNASLPFRDALYTTLTSLPVARRAA